MRVILRGGLTMATVQVRAYRTQRGRDAASLSDKGFVNVGHACDPKELMLLGTIHRDFRWCIYISGRSILKNQDEAMQLLGAVWVVDTRSRPMDGHWEYNGEPL